MKARRHQEGYRAKAAMDALEAERALSRQIKADLHQKRFRTKGAIDALEVERGLSRRQAERGEVDFEPMKSTGISHRRREARRDRNVRLGGNKAISEESIQTLREGTILWASRTLYSTQTPDREPIPSREAKPRRSPGLSRTLSQERKTAATKKQMADLASFEDESDQLSTSLKESIPRLVTSPAIGGLVSVPEELASESRTISKDYVIAFVEELEKAYQYAQLKEYLREEYDMIKQDIMQSDLEGKLVEMKEQKGMFNLIEIKEIQNVVKEHYWRLKAERYAYLKAITGRQKEKGHDAKNRFSFLVEEDIQDAIDDRFLKYKAELAAIKRAMHIFPCHLTDRNNQMKQKERDALWDPIKYLVVRTCEEGYVLDENVYAELEKLKKYTPMFYDWFFVYRKPKVAAEARTVTVRNLSIDVTEENIKATFGCGGGIEDIEMQRMQGCQFAHVTYMYLSGAEYALKYTGRRIPSLSMAIRGHGSLRYTPLEVQARKYDKPAKSDREKAEDLNNSYREALAKYSVLRAQLCEFRWKRVW